MIADSLLQSRRVVYHFSSKSVPLNCSASFSRLEKSLFAAAAKHDLKLFRVRGILRGTLTGEVRVYRLSSKAHHAFCDFILEAGGVNLLLLHVLPEYQGHFFTLKDFINRFAKTAWEMGATKIFGAASPVDGYPVRQKVDWRTLPAKNGKMSKLLRLYEVLGFSVSPLTQTFHLNAPQCP